MTYTRNSQLVYYDLVSKTASVIALRIIRIMKFTQVPMPLEV